MLALLIISNNLISQIIYLICNLNIPLYASQLNLRNKISLDYILVIFFKNFFVVMDFLVVAIGI